MSASPRPPCLLFVCTSCVRGETVATDSPGRRLAAALQVAAGEAGAIEIRAVACLNACRSPCNVALRGRHRWTYRFSRCTLADVDTLLAAARSYWTAPRGAIAAEDWPAPLRARLSASTSPPEH